MEHVNCDLCGSDSDNAVVLWDKTEREKAGVLRSVVIRDEQGNIIQGRNVICKRCGLVYVTPRLTKKELDRFYAEDYRKIYNGGHGFEAEKRHAENAFQVLQGIRPFSRLRYLPEGKLLDVGCSTGKLLERIGWEINVGLYGIEPNLEYCEIAKASKVANLNVENCTIEDYNPDFRFDTITMLNALEHVFSPTAVLTKIHGLLNEDGHVLISVPNLLSTHINIPVDAFLSNVHLYNFTPATLGIMAQKCGFRPVKIFSISEEMGEKIYMLVQKSESVEVVYDDNIEKRIEFTKMFLEYSDRLFVLKHVLSNGIK